MKPRLAAIFALALVLIAPVSLSANAASISNDLLLTVYPDGSVKIGFNQTQTAMLQPATQPTVTSRARATTSGGVTTITLNSTESLPSKLLNQAPYNYSASISASGSYSNGMSRGYIVVQAVPGVSSPGASLKLSYHGNSDSLSVSGNTTLQYGTYGTGSSQVVLNAVTIGQYLQVLQNEGLNSSRIRSLLAQANAMFPQGGFSLTSFALNAVYGSDSATVSGDISLTGNMTTLPFLIAGLFFLPAAQNLTSTTTSPFSPSSLSLFPAYSAMIASIHEYTYSISYASGIASLSVKLTGAQGLNLDQVVKLFGLSAAGQGASPVAAKFLNTTRVDISTLSVDVNEAQKASGEFDTSFSMSGLTIYPQVLESGGKLNESGLFNSLGTGPANITVTGGTNAQGSVRVIVPAGVTAPTSSTAMSQRWSGVNANALAGLQFSVSQPSTTSTTSSTSGNGGIPEFPAQLDFIILVAIIMVVSYLFARRGLRAGK